MNKFERWIFKKILRNNIKQGYDSNLDEMFELIRAEAEFTFHEDNMVTLDSFMHDHFEKTQKTTWSQTCKTYEGFYRQPVEVK